MRACEKFAHLLRTPLRRSIFSPALNLRQASAIAALLLITVIASNASAAGKVTLAIGAAGVENTAGKRGLRRGDRIVEGDLLRVGANSLLQLQMDDGAMIALRSNTEFRVDTYRFAANGRPALTVMSLFKGGFRTVTGLIGRINRDEYQVATPVATIGIRGTDYSALYCANDCQNALNGLHARVSEGAIVARNLSGVELLLTQGEYGYVPDGQTPPERRDQAPKDMGIEMPPIPETANAESLPTPPPPTGEGSVAQAGDEPGLREIGEVDVMLEARPEPNKKAKGSVDNDGRFEANGGRFRASGGDRQAIAFAAPEDHAARVGTSGETLLSDDGTLLAFFTGDDVLAIGDAQTRDSGLDTATGLRWGRWTDGTALRDGEALPLEGDSLHWIYGGDLGGGAPALPKTGEASFTLVGNTSPTDNGGQTGFLGSATLSADFTNQTVDSSLRIGFTDAAGAGTVWQASGSGQITQDSLLFGGDYDRVTVNGVANGSGDFNGFFVPGAADGATPLGAGLSYTLGNDGTTVNGTAAFGNASGGTQ
ncbi:MAG: FecR family protein [Panacagrimonas sp.]